MKNVTLLIAAAVLIVSSVGCSDSGSGISSEDLMKYGKERDAAQATALKPLADAVNKLADKIDSKGSADDSSPRTYLPGSLTAEKHYYMGADGKYHEEVLQVPTPKVVPSPCPAPIIVQPQPCPQPVVVAPACRPVRDNCRCGVPWGPWVDAGRGGLQVRTSHCGQTQTRRTSTAH